MAKPYIDGKTSSAYYSYLASIKHSTKRKYVFSLESSSRLDVKRHYKHGEYCYEIRRRKKNAKI